MNYSANENQASLKGVRREGWVVRTHGLLWLTHAMGRWTGPSSLCGLGQGLLMGELYFMGRFPAQVQDWEATWAGEKSSKRRLLFYALGWVGVQIRVQGRLTRRPWHSLLLFLYPGS